MFRKNRRPRQLCRCRIANLWLGRMSRRLPNLTRRRVHRRRCWLHNRYRYRTNLFWRRSVGRVRTISRWSLKLQFGMRFFHILGYHQAQTNHLRNIDSIYYSYTPTFIVKRTMRMSILGITAPLLGCSDPVRKSPQKVGLSDSDEIPVPKTPSIMMGMDFHWWLWWHTRWCQSRRQRTLWWHRQWLWWGNRRRWSRSPRWSALIRRRGWGWIWWQSIYHNCMRRGLWLCLQCRWLWWSKPQYSSRSHRNMWWRGQQLWWRGRRKCRFALVCRWWLWWVWRQPSSVTACQQPWICIQWLGLRWHRTHNQLVRTKYVILSTTIAMEIPMKMPSMQVYITWTTMPTYGINVHFSLWSTQWIQLTTWL